MDDAAAAILASFGGATAAAGNKNKKKKQNKNKPNNATTEDVETAEDIANEVHEEENINLNHNDDKKKKKGKKEKEKPVSAMGKLVAERMRQQQEEQLALERLQKEQMDKELEEQRKAEEAERLEAERKQRDKEEKKRKKEELKKQGKYLTKSQKQKAARAELMKETLIAQGRIQALNINQNLDDNTHNHENKLTQDVVLTEEEVDDDEKEEIENVAEDNLKAEVGESWESKVELTDWEKEFTQPVEPVSKEQTNVVPKKVESVTAISPAETQKPNINVLEKELRSPICVVMGHVDTGKTKMLDKLRKTNVQEGEAGGITQQIGATFFPMDKLRATTDRLNKDLDFEYKVPGLLMIDTPGHESFSNLRKRGSGLADIAILIVDLMHGLEQQTIESIHLLRESKTPFIVALNKIDRLYNWQPTKDSPFRESLAKQDENVLLEFESRTKQVVTQLMEQGLNSKLYYENKDFKSTVCLVPTSAHTGEGVPDLLLLLIQLTQKMLFKKLTLKPRLECNVIEVKKIEGLGTSIDVILVNGELHENDEIIAATLSGPVRTQIKALLTPQPLKEMRVKGSYVHHKSIRAAMGIKIVAPDLEDAIAGTEIAVIDPKKAHNSAYIKELETFVMKDFDTIIKSIDQTGYGVCVQASTLGSLEALVDFLKNMKIPINSVNLGPIHKKDVMRASVMLEHKKEFATILAFDVKVTKDALEASEELGVKIFTAEIIYHLFDQFTKYMEQVNATKKQEVSGVAVFPCILKIIPENIFNKKSPLILGVEVVDGILKTGTPLVVPDKLVPNPDNPDEMLMLSLGKVESIEKDHKDVPIAKRGSKVCIKIVGSQSESYVQFGRHFDEKSELCSKLTRESIDALKENFKEELDKADWLLVIKLKKTFDIQ